MPEFHTLTPEQVVEAEDLMAQLDEQADREERRFTPAETQAWHAAHDMVVADTMAKAGLEPDPDGKLPAFVWDRDSAMWRPDIEGVNHMGPAPVQHEIDGEDPPLGFLVPPARSVEEACAAVAEACVRAADEPPAALREANSANTTGDAEADD
jgi:hypothetical protein